MQKENWKDIPNYEGIYQVSDLGNFRSCDRMVLFNKVKALKKGRVLKLRQSNDGYLYTVFSVDSKRKTIKPHRIVAEVFLVNTLNKPCVNHINGIKSDNKLSNLEWVTYSENTIHAVKIGLKKGVRGVESHLSKLTIMEVEKIRLIYSNGGISQKKLGENFGVSQSQIARIVNKVNWF